MIGTKIDKSRHSKMKFRKVAIRSEAVDFEIM